MSTSNKWRNAASGTRFFTVSFLFFSFLNFTNAQFSRVAVDPGIEVSTTSNGGHAWGDLNDDGYPDLILYLSSNSSAVDAKMYFNDGPPNYTFTDTTDNSIAGFDNSVRFGRQMLIVDFNNDGYNDVLSGGGGNSDVEIYFNDGPPNFTFGDVNQDPDFVITSSLVTDSGEYNMEGIGAIDWNQDGWLDILMDNDGGSNDIFENNGDGTFTYLHPGSGDVTGFAQSHSGDGDYLTVADINNDGYVDLYGRKSAVSNYWRFDPVDSIFVNQANPNIVSSEGDKGGTMFCDFDSDGDLDLFWTANGNNEIWRNDGRDISGNDIWTATGIPAAPLRTQSDIDGCDCGDVDNDGDLDIVLGASSGNSYLLVNQLAQSGSMTFTQTNIAVNRNTESVSFSDYDMDGDLDLYFVTSSNVNQLWINGTDDSNYLYVNVEVDNGNGTTRAAIGANVVLLDCNQNTVGMRQVNGAKGHGSQHQTKLHFGVNPNETYTMVAYYVFKNGSRKVIKRAIRPADYPNQTYTVYDTDVSEANLACLPDTDNDGVIDAEDIDSDNDGVPNALELNCGIGDWSAGGSRTGTVALTSGVDTVGEMGDVFPVATIDIVTGTSLDYDFIENGIASALDGTLSDGVVTTVNGLLAEGRFKFDFGQSVGNLNIDIGDLDTEIIDSIKAYYNGIEIILGINNFSNINSQVNYQGNTLFSNFNNADILYSDNAGSFTMSISEPVDSFVVYVHSDDSELTFSNIAYCEFFDNDGDGIADYQDLDSDNDGIPDLIEAGGVDLDGDGRADNLTDTDLDGLVDIFDNNDTDGPNGSGADPTTPSTSVLLDTNQDGISDSGDNDADNIPNYLDLDSDNDGLPDIIEVGGIDIEGDGRVDNRNPDGTLIDDFDQDGFSDEYDPDNDLVAGIDINGTNQPLTKTNGAGAILGLDLENDGFPNFLDLDADGDGIPDLIEAGGVDLNGDGKVPTTGSWDEDQDGYTDIYDANASDGPGNNGTNGTPLVITTTDDGAGGGTANDGHVNGDEAIISNLSGIIIDNDGDRIPTFWDLDSDDDGITDAVESPSGDANNDGLADDKGAYNDVNNDGLEDSHVGRINNTPDNADPDGWPQFTASSTGDLDLDGFPAWIDIDADNDGIVDNSEGQPTASYIAPGPNDFDQDGLNDAYDDQIGTFAGNGISPENTDGNDLPDFLDDDADNDGELDTLEGHDTNNDGTPNANAFTMNGVPNGMDIDGDGLDDGYDSNTASTDPTNGGTRPLDYPDTDLGNADQDWRAANGNLGGLAWEDANQDGIKDDIETIISGVWVTLFTQAGTNLGSQQTDASGQYLFTDLVNGNYYVHVSFPVAYNTFSPQDQGADDTIDSDIVIGTGNSSIVSITAGNPSISVDAGMYAGVVPVELTAFDGKAKGCEVELSWHTATEVGFDHFEVEKSADGQKFEPIKQVQSNGSFGAYYYLIDENAGTENYYRLKMIDRDGTFEYSDIIKVNTNCKVEISAIKVYPNPITSRAEILNVKLFSELKNNQTSEIIPLILSDRLGRQVMQVSAELQEGWNTIQIDLNNLPTGLYFIRPISGRKIMAKRFLVIDES